MKDDYNTTIILPLKKFKLLLHEKETTTPDPQKEYQGYGRNELISYQKLRAFIGMTGILLPVFMVLGCWVFKAGRNSFQVSISHYYYSVAHIIFIGMLCVLGGFLITYRGKDKWESRVSNIAGCFAFGIAAFPPPSRDSFPKKMEFIIISL